MIFKREYRITLNDTEADSLKILLGNLTDEDFAKAGVGGSGREFMSELYDKLTETSD